MILPDDQLLDLVIKSKLADEKAIRDAAEHAKLSGISLEQSLVERSVIPDAKLGEAVAQNLKLPFVSLSGVSIPEDVIYLIPSRVARRFKLIAFARTQEGIKVAVNNPDQKLVLENLARKTGQKVIPFLATTKDIESTLLVYKKDLQSEVDNLLKEDMGRPMGSPFEDPPVANIVDLLINSAYEEKASDIHIEPQEQSSLVRFRVDGILQDILLVPMMLHDRMITRIKVLSNLRTDEHLSAQDGKMRIPLEEENLDIRVSIIPIAGGEKAVLRLLSSRSRELSLKDLGMNEVDLAKITRAYNKSYGMILSTGPTGSGKTTSIYAILKILNVREKNITTIEDPVEYHIKGANQVQTNAKTNLTFAQGLRSILRQDPNIIFVGEIRDNETAGIAVNAALTGHLVLSTLHTNDAATAIPRLTDMKVEPFLVSSTVSVIFAQRLVRKVCSFCRQESTIDMEEMGKNFPPEVIKRNYGDKKTINIAKGKGCKMCRQSGYLGRVGLFEVLEVTPVIRKLINEKNDADTIGKAAVKEGMTVMIDDGLIKISQGVTTIEEVLRVTRSEFV